MNTYDTGSGGHTNTFTTAWYANVTHSSTSSLRLLPETTYAATWRPHQIFEVDLFNTRTCRILEPRKWSKSDCSSHHRQRAKLTDSRSGGLRPHKRRAPTAPLQAARSVAPSTNMEQATILGLLTHIVKLTEIVEEMSTNIVILNEKLDSNTKKVDRLLKRDVPATLLVNGRGDDGGQGSGVPTRPSTEPASARIEVVDMREIQGQGAAGSTESNSTMSTAGVSPLSHNVSPGSGRPSTPRHQRRASVVPDALMDDPPTDSNSAGHARDYSVFEGFDDFHPTTPPMKRARLGDTASAYGDTKTKAPSSPVPEVLSNTNIDGKSKPPARSSFAEAFNNTKSHVKSKVKPRPTSASAFAVVPSDTSTHTSSKPQSRQMTASTIGSKHAQPTTQEAPREKKNRRPSTAEDIFEPRKEKTKKRGGAVTKAKGAAFNMEAPRKRQRMIDQLYSPNAK